MTCGDSQCTRAPTFVLSVINNLDCWKSDCCICHVTEVSSLVLYVLSIHTSAVTATPVLLSLHRMGSCHQAEVSIKRMAVCLYLYIYPLTFYCNICHVIKVSGLFCHLHFFLHTFGLYVHLSQRCFCSIIITSIGFCFWSAMSFDDLQAFFFFYIYPAVLQMLWCLPPVCSW